MILICAFNINKRQLWAELTKTAMKTTTLMRTKRRIRIMSKVMIMLLIVAID